MRVIFFRTQVRQPRGRALEYAAAVAAARSSTAAAAAVAAATVKHKVSGRVQRAHVVAVRSSSAS